MSKANSRIKDPSFIKLTSMKIWTFISPPPCQCVSVVQGMELLLSWKITFEGWGWVSCTKPGVIVCSKKGGGESKKATKCCTPLFFFCCTQHPAQYFNVGSLQAAVLHSAMLWLWGLWLFGWDVWLRLRPVWYCVALWGRCVVKRQRAASLSSPLLIEASPH